jgi:DNA-binding NarL/FixJ family response regulator
MLSEVHIVIAEGDPKLRTGLARLLAGQQGFEVAAETESGRDAIVAVREFGPDVLLFDMELPDMSGLDVLRQLGRVKDTHSIALIDKPDVYQMTQALLLGACGAIEKSARAPVLFKCLRSVLAGELWFRRDVTKALLEYVDRSDDDRHSGHELIDRLTQREGDILRAVGSGMPNKEIAAKLTISEYTVKHHLSRIFAKLSVSNRVELALLAAKYDL